MNFISLYQAHLKNQERLPLEKYSQVFGRDQCSNYSINIGAFVNNGGSRRKTEMLQKNRSVT